MEWISWSMMIMAWSVVVIWIIVLASLNRKHCRCTTLLLSGVKEIGPKLLRLEMVYDCVLVGGVIYSLLLLLITVSWFIYRYSVYGVLSP